MSSAPADPADVVGRARPAVGVAMVGGALGTAARLGLTEAMALDNAVLVANLVGAFALGWLYARVQDQRKRGSRLWSVCGPGFLGAFTTFSALQFEVVEQAAEGYWLHAAGYLGVSIGLGIPLAALGHYLGRRRP